MKQVVMGSDHAGFRMKEFLKEKLEAAGYEVEDKGPYDEAPADAGTYAIAVGDEVAARPQKRGILICGTGIGMSMMANKVRGVRASLVTDLFSAQMTRAHNDANVLCLGSRIVAEAMAWEFVKVWLNTEHLGGKYAERVRRMMEYERKRS